MPPQIKLKSFELRRNSFLNPRQTYLVFTRMVDAVLLPQSCYYPNPTEGAGSVGGQLRGDKECPFSGVTSSSRVWRKMPESAVRSVPLVGTSFTTVTPVTADRMFNVRQVTADETFKVKAT